MFEQMSRRDVLRRGAAFGWTVTTGGVLVAADDRCLATPQQTPGPFYPVPEIRKQPVHDTDLTRKLAKSDLALGQVIVIDGQVKDLACRPLAGAVVEVWQACASGRYNHPRDTNQAKLDEKFQFWGRAVTDEQGRYTFRTIKPGEYPGRTAHVHYRVLAEGHRGLVTQMYFADQARRNAKDFIYTRLDRRERDLVTVEFAKPTGKEDPHGTFDIVLPKA